MNEENEKDQQWVDDLLAQLPTPVPVPDDVSRNLNQFLAERVAELQAQSNVVSLSTSRSPSRVSESFSRRYQFMLAAAAVTGLLVFVGTQSSLFNSAPKGSDIAAPVSSPSAAPETSAQEESKEVPTSGESAEVTEGSEPAAKSPAKKPESKNTSGMIDAEVTNTEIQVLGSEGGTEYLPSDAPDVQITKSGKDYATSLDEILNEVAPYGEPGKVNKLSTNQLKCIVQLKLVDRVIAVDSGTYKGSNVVTFFAFADDGTTKAYVTVPGNNCTLVKKIPIN